MTDDQLKKLVKAALVEVLEERRDLIQELLEEALEDVWPSPVRLRKANAQN